MKYDFTNIEKKWQKVWEDNHTFEAVEDHTRPKFYGLVEFPYPMGRVCTWDTSRPIRVLR